jgi:hypothetical protein
MNKNPRLNSSGCKDLTAFEAIKHISDQEKKANILIKDLKIKIKDSGFELVGRIIIIDKKGREYR